MISSFFVRERLQYVGISLLAALDEAVNMEQLWSLLLLGISAAGLHRIRGGGVASWE